ncbi:MAG: hypothetical protein WCS37_16105 [Chloroflexota bacterium]
MAQYTNDERDMEQTGSGEQIRVEVDAIGENIDLKGGRVLNIPDFVELATQGFSEGELKDILRLRRRYENSNDYELTAEYKRLRFAKWLYKQGKLDG